MTFDQVVVNAIPFGAEFLVQHTYPNTHRLIIISDYNAVLQFCGKATDNLGECSRSILGFLGPFYFKLFWFTNFTYIPLACPLIANIFI